MAQISRRTSYNDTSGYDRYIQGSSYYSRTSQAYKLEAYAQPAEEYEPEPRRRAPSRKPSPAQPAVKAHPAKKVKKAKVQRGTPKPETVYQLNMQNHRAFSPMSFLLVAVVFVGILSWVASTAHAAQRRYALTVAQSALKTIKQENSDLMKDLYEGYDLADIEYIATAKLGMTKPEEHQLVHISVPKQSYSVQYDNTVENEQKLPLFSLSTLVNFFIKD